MRAKALYTFSIGSICYVHVERIENSTVLDSRPNAASIRANSSSKYKKQSSVRQVTKPAIQGNQKVIIHENPIIDVK